MVEFITANRALVSSKFDLAIDMARFEWAQILAFDGPVKPRITVDDLLGKNPKTLRLGLQPYLSVLICAMPWMILASSSSRMAFVARQATRLRNPINPASPPNRCGRRCPRASGFLSSCIDTTMSCITSD